MPVDATAQSDIGTFQGEVTALDRQIAIRKLKSMLTTADLRACFKAMLSSTHGASIERILAAASDGAPRRRGRIADGDIPELVVDIKGSEMLAIRELRHRLALRCEAEDLRILHDEGSGRRARRGRATQAEAVANRSWFAGKRWALHFTRTLGFPVVFAGDPGSKREPEVLDIAPFVPLPKLVDFQSELQRRLQVVLNARPGGNRSILTLPTGAGKTRTAVETLLDWRIEQPTRPTILWIAQSEELCEQAVQSFREVWFDHGNRKDVVREPIRIGRLWATNDIPIAECSVIVASIQKLDAIWRSEEDREELVALRELLGVILIDEAHRALSRTYTRVLTELGIRPGRRSETPLIGLTATPYRSSPGETDRLLARFHRKVLRPSRLGDDPLEELRNRGVLSRVKVRLIDYADTPHELDEDETYLAYFEEFEDLHPKLLRELAEDADRNLRLLDEILAMPDDWAVLVFACSVEHAQALTVLLRRRGRSAGCVTGATRQATRRALVEQFRQRRMSVLCNYGVLTTGFDAPQVRAVVVARPTASAVLYEQMIGRGMRGPKFGGTEECLVLDVADNIRYHDRPALVRYAEIEKEMRRTAETVS